VGKKSKAYSDYQVVLLWVLPYFLLISLAQVKFMRYLLPMTPFMILFGAALIWQIPSKIWPPLISTVAIAATGLYAFAFSNLYAQPHPLTIASEWLKEHISSRTTVAGEEWDELILPKGIEVIDWLSPSGKKDDQRKLERNLSILANADYYTVNSSRIYITLARDREAYPLSSQFHPLLFDGDLGFQLVYATDRGPNLFDLTFWPERFGLFGLTPPEEIATMFKSSYTLGRADESFIIYDQPLVMIFINSEHLSPEEMLASFDLIP
jgi:hypothetical protein